MNSVIPISFFTCECNLPISLLYIYAHTPLMTNAPCSRTVSLVSLEYQYTTTTDSTSCALYELLDGGWGRDSGWPQPCEGRKAVRLPTRKTCDKHLEILHIVLSYR